jgi:hypothetical protein
MYLPSGFFREKKRKWQMKKHRHLPPLARGLYASPMFGYAMNVQVQMEF